MLCSTFLTRQGESDGTQWMKYSLQKGQGVPSREPVFTEDDKKQMMSYAYKKQEEMKVWCTFQTFNVIKMPLKQAAVFLVCSKNLAIIYL